MAKRSVLNHKHDEPKKTGYLCSTCEAEGFSDVFPTVEARQLHFDETGHGARNLMQQEPAQATESFLQRRILPNLDVRFAVCG